MTRTEARTTTPNPAGARAAGASARTVAAINRAFGVTDPPEVDEVVEAAEDIYRALAEFRAFLDEWRQRA